MPHNLTRPDDCDLRTLAGRRWKNVGVRQILDEAVV